MHITLRQSQLHGRRSPSTCRFRAATPLAVAPGRWLDLRKQIYTVQRKPYKFTGAKISLHSQKSIFLKLVGLVGHKCGVAAGQ